MGCGYLGDFRAKEFVLKKKVSLDTLVSKNLRKFLIHKWIKYTLNSFHIPRFDI